MSKTTLKKMSVEQSQEDLKAGGEGDEVAEPIAEKDDATKSQSAIVVAKRSTVSATGYSSKHGSATASKSGSVSAVKSSSAAVSRRGSAQRQESTSSQKTAKGSKMSVGAKTSASSKVSVTSKSPKREKSKASEERLVTFSRQEVPGILVEETEEELEEETEGPGEQGEEDVSARSSATGLRASFESMVEADSRVRPSTSSFLALRKHSTTAQSAIWSSGPVAQVSRVMSTVIESVAHTHASAIFRDASQSLSDMTSRRSTGFISTVSTARLDGRAKRSVWKDADILNVLGPIRMDALGEHVISSREASEEAVEGQTTQFDIRREADEKHDKTFVQLMHPKDEYHSIGADLSPNASVVASSIITSFWPPEPSEMKTGHDLGFRSMLEQEPDEEPGPPEVEVKRVISKELIEPATIEPEPQLESIVVKPRDSCHHEDTCFDRKEEISSTELWAYPSQIVPTEYVHVRFRLATGQVLKRIYRSDDIFRDTLWDLAVILCINPETIKLSVEGEDLDLDAKVWDICGISRTEVLVESQFCLEQIYDLVEKGYMSFSDDRALKYFLLRRLPCAPDTKQRYVRPVTAPKTVLEPTSFIPGLVDDRKWDGSVSWELEKQLELARCVKCIQSSFRCYLSKRTFGQKRHSEPEPIKVSPADEASCKRYALMKDVNLLTKEDFTVLYNLLEEWWRSEADVIKRNNSAAAKTARLFNLLLLEIDYMRHIEVHRCKLKQERRSARLSALVEKAVEWDSLTEWERVELFSLLKSCARQLCLDSKKSVGDRSAIQIAISSDMNAIIEGNYERNGDPACLTYCYSCHRSLPTWRFKPSTASTRLYSCEKCQGLANLGRTRRDTQAVRLMMEDVRGEEARRGGCAGLPYIMQEKDFVTLAKLWHNASAVSGASCGLRFVRWDPGEEWSPWNTVLLTREEAEVHQICAYGQDFVGTVKRRHLTAKWTFRNLIELEKETRRKLRERDLKDNDGVQAIRGGHVGQGYQGYQGFEQAQPDAGADDVDFCCFCRTF